MKRFALIATTALTLAASVPVLCITPTASSAQEGWRSVMDEHRDSRDALLDRLRRRQEIRRDLRDLLEDRIRERQDLRELITDLRDSDDGFGERFRGRIRERLRERVGDLDDEDGEHGWRGRVRERLADLRRGREGENCFFITRSIRDEDRDFFALVRRRVCRD
jgi:hypothetical protein